MAPVRVALVGLGEIGIGAHLPALLRNPAVTVAALVDPAPQRRELGRRSASTMGRPIPTVADLAEVPDDVPAVVLATPPWVTPCLAVGALQAGRYVLTEKPIATSTASAAAYDVLTEAQRRRLQVGLTYRHDPAIEQLHTWLRRGTLGAPLLVRAHIYDERHDPADPTHRRRIEATLAHGSPVVHEGAHVFDWLAVLLGGPPSQLDDAWALRTEPAFANPNVTGARLTYPSGTALVEFGWLTDALPRCEISVLGPRGHAVLDGLTFRLQLSTVDEQSIVEFPGDRTARCFDRQVARFVDLVAGRAASPEPDLADGLAALATSELVASAAKEFS